MLTPTTTAQSAPWNSQETPLADGLLAAACAGTGQRAAFCLRLHPSTVPAHLQTGAVFTNSRCPHSLLPPFPAQRASQSVHGDTSTALTTLLRPPRGNGEEPWGTSAAPIFTKTPMKVERGVLQYPCSPVRGWGAETFAQSGTLAMRHSGFCRQEGTARQSCQLEAAPTAPQPAHSPQLSLHITSCLFTALCQGKHPCQLHTAAPGSVWRDHHSTDTLACPRHPEPPPSTASTAIHSSHSKHQ